MVAEAQRRMGTDTYSFFYRERQQYTDADDAKLLENPDEVARREAENNLALADLVDDVIRTWLSRGGFRLHQGVFRHLQLIAAQGLGLTFEQLTDFRVTPAKSREADIGSPGPNSAARELERLCDYVNENWHSGAVHLAAFTIWRTHWICPFLPANECTARAAGYVVLGIRLGSFLPGIPTIPEQIAADDKSYYVALEVADQAWASGKIDVSAVERLLGPILEQQLLSTSQNRA
jgi:hypothetical protein